MSVQDELGTRYKCLKCDHAGGRTKRFAVSGTGLSKLLDIQHNQFIAVSCNNCGFTEIYNPEVLEGKRHLGNVLDVIFGS